MTLGDRKLPGVVDLHLILEVAQAVRDTQNSIAGPAFLSKRTSTSSRNFCCVRNFQICPSGVDIRSGSVMIL